MKENYLTIYNPFWLSILNKQEKKPFQLNTKVKSIKIYLRKNSKHPDKRRKEWKVILAHRPGFGYVLGGEVKVG